MVTVDESIKQLFEQYYPPLKSYLYRMTASEQDAEDIASETFLRVMHKYESFEGRARIKTWIFTIATHLARDHFRVQKRWPVNAQDQAKRVASVQALKDDLQNLERSNPEVKYEIKEHIDFCFTCMMKTLPLEQQIVLMLKNIYGFKVDEIKIIVAKTEAAVKNLLHQARKTLTEIFESRCSLVSQKGVCYQCSELNGLLNPKQNAQEELVKLKMVQQARKNPADQERLLDLRLKLIGEIDPCQGKSAALHLSHMKMLRQAIQDDEATAAKKSTI
jgi:RNA polymerase sigma-70 factor (ECF subfamily)